MACTFDSPCLTSLVNGAQPSFGFKPSNTGYFGIQASFTHGPHKCYESLQPTWTPLIKSGAYEVPCTYIGAVQSLYCPQLPVSEIGIGTHTLSYSAPRGSPAPFKPTTFVVAYPPSSMPDQPVVATDYITVTRPFSTTTRTFTTTISKGKTVTVKTGTTYERGPTSTETKYTNSRPKAMPTFTTTTKNTGTYKIVTVKSTTTAGCGDAKPSKGGNPWEQDGEGGKPWWVEAGVPPPWVQEGGEQVPPRGSGGSPQGNGEQQGPQEDGEQQGPPQEGGEQQGPPSSNGAPQWGAEQEGGRPSEEQGKEWQKEHPWGAPPVRVNAAPLMNYGAVETVSAGVTMRVPMPCKGACGGWSGPDATFTGPAYPKQTDDQYTITWTKTTTKKYGVKTRYTTVPTWKVSVSVKKTPSTTSTVPKFTTTTKTLPPKYTPVWTKTITTTKTWTKKTTTTNVKTLPCTVKTVTSLETATFVETLQSGEWNARVTAPAVAVNEPAAPEAIADADCPDCQKGKEFSWADVVAERKADLLPEQTLTAGAKFRL